MHTPLHLPPIIPLDTNRQPPEDVEQRSPQSPTATNSASQTPEPSSQRPSATPPSPVPSPGHNDALGRRLPSIVTTASTIQPHSSSSSSTLKRPRSPSLLLSATILHSPSTLEPPRKKNSIIMSRFAQQQAPPNSADAWNHHHQIHQDRVVLPPLATAVDNGLTPSRRTSMASPSAYSANGQGAYAFTNTFESQRPATASSASGMTSPSLSTVRMDLSQDNVHPHPYRRPSMGGRAQTAIVSRNPPTSPLVQDIPRMTHAYNDPNTGMSWNIPPPSSNNAGGPESANRPSTATYSAYGDYTTTDFTGNLTTNSEGTPQSPSFAFASSGFSTAQQAAGMYNIGGGHQRAAHPPPHHPGFTLAQAAAIASQPTPPPSNASSSTTLMDHSQNRAAPPAEEELSQLRTKVRELEFVNDLVQLRVVELENERTKYINGSDKTSISPSSPNGTSSSRSSTLNGSPHPDDQDFGSSWEKRTEARIKRFCSLNRAGNALCAWHDSRRERRAYPPRMAPPGTLNCGCTYEEALFEESLSRHKVGSYLPGEMVRMDPALRNPLLALLQWRYGYKDGDFERDPDTGRWVNGEGEQVWMQKASTGSTTGSRRKQSDGDSI